jgi:xanthine dehydrogenase accessory factor
MSVSAELDQLLDALHQTLADGSTAALATLVRTRGSTFRRAGTAMLVHADGRVVCALSGGCPQRDIVHRARDVIRDERATLARYDPEHGLDVMMEMGCEGELEVLIEPLAAQLEHDWVARLRSWRGQRREGVLATAYSGPGGAILPHPRRLLWSGAVLHDALRDNLLREQLEACLQQPPARTTVVTLRGSEGPVGILLQPLSPRYRLLLIGSHSGAQALARVGLQLGWQVTVVDADSEALACSEMPEAVHRLAAGPDALRKQLHADRYSAAVVMTHHLYRDIEYLNALADAPLAYLGALGSRQRAARMQQATGLDATRLRAPAGLDIGSETPQEIAVAVAAEIMAQMHRREGRALSAHDGPIHD